MHCEWNTGRYFNFSVSRLCCFLFCCSVNCFCTNTNLYFCWCDKCPVIIRSEHNGHRRRRNNTIHGYTCVQDGTKGVWAMWLGTDAELFKSASGNDVWLVCRQSILEIFCAPEIRYCFWSIYLTHCPSTSKCLTNYMERNPSSKASSLSATEEFNDILWNPKFPYLIHKSPPTVSIPSQTDPVHNTPSWYSLLQYTSRSSWRLFSSGFSTVIIYAFLFFPCMLHALPI